MTAPTTNASNPQPFDRRAPETPVDVTRGDLVTVALATCAVLFLYWRTLLPHLGGTEDTAKFQYLGAVLGTAHSPGYPLYVLLSWAFSHLPFGTLAYRINFMSACCGTATIACFMLSALRLGCHRFTALAAGLSLATGHYFWEDSVIAEVYTLNTALWSAAVWLLLRYKDSGRERDLFGATLAVALGLGNHLTILGLIPAAFAYLFLSGRPWYRLRTVLISALILALGVAQYGFVWLRTAQSGKYLESRASNLAELFAVVSARRYAGLMFHFDLHAMLTERVPLLWSFLVMELGYAGIAAAVLGLVMLRRRPGPALLLAVSIAAILGLTANVVADVGGFLLPAFVMLWLAAAAALEGLRSIARRRVGSAGAAAFLVVAFTLPVAQFRDNFTTADFHNERFATDYFQTLFRSLPDRSAVITDDYTPEQMLLYGTVSGDFRRTAPPIESASSDPDEVDRLLASGISVFAFPRAVDPLRSFGFTLTPFPLWGLTLRQFATDIDDGQLVAVGASGVTLPNELVEALDGRSVRVPTSVPTTAIVAVKHSKGLHIDSVDGAAATLALAAGDAVGSGSVRLPASVRVEATPETATISIDGREPFVAKSGVAIVVFDRDGRVRDERRFEPEHGFTSEQRVGPWALVQVTRTRACLALGDNRWHDLSQVGPGGGIDARLDDRQPFDASMVLYLTSTKPLEPAMTGYYGGCQGAEPCPTIDRPQTAIESFARGPASEDDRLRGRLDADGLDWQDAFAQATYVYRMTISANDRGQFVAFWVDFNGRPGGVFARAHTDQAAPQRAAVCSRPQADPSSTR